jgi:hypothetical protein
MWDSASFVLRWEVVAVSAAVGHGELGYVGSWDCIACLSSQLHRGRGYIRSRGAPGP